MTAAEPGPRRGDRDGSVARPVAVGVVAVAQDKLDARTIAVGPVVVGHDERRLNLDDLLPPIVHQQLLGDGGGRRRLGEDRRRRLGGYQVQQRLPLGIQPVLRQRRHLHERLARGGIEDRLAAGAAVGVGQQRLQVGPQQPLGALRQGVRQGLPERGEHGRVGAPLRAARRIRCPVQVHQAHLLGVGGRPAATSARRRNTVWPMRWNRAADARPGRSRTTLRWRRLWRPSSRASSAGRQPVVAAQPAVVAVHAAEANGTGRHPNGHPTGPVNGNGRHGEGPTPQQEPCSWAEFLAQVPAKPKGRRKQPPASLPLFEWVLAQEREAALVGRSA